MKEYRIVWQREGCFKRYKTYKTKKGCDRWVALLTNDEPWKAFGYEPDEAMCCDGRECGCGGKTYRESFAEKSQSIPKLLTYQIQEREVNNWTLTPSPGA